MRTRIHFFAVAALAVSLVLALSLTPRGRAIAQQAGGAFVPTFNYLRSGIDNYQNGIQLNGAGLHTYSVTLSNAQFIALNATPITIIPLCSANPTNNPACIPANYVAVPIYGSVSFNEFATYAGGNDLKLFYTSRTAGNAASGTITFAGLFDTGTSNNEQFTGVIAGPESGKTAKAVVIQEIAATAITSGDGRNSVNVQVVAQVYPSIALN